MAALSAAVKVAVLFVITRKAIPGGKEIQTRDQDGQSD
jgi:hypothetical protein